MHGIFWWIIVGFVAGVLAKALVPGDNKEPKGCLYTILLGIGGSVLTGIVLHYGLGWRTGGHFIGTIVGATIGAVVLILAFRKFWK
ncbi:MAG TPA: GlsB/YeaQ/YmgE family stress response membrane protein [Fimbriimonadaceae bacterium]|nr:GlsB/YeaQ/YmgE family stress response membrane protein [Fimbriimonadaceae bacterium]